MTRSQRILCQHHKLILTHSLTSSQRLLIQPFNAHQLRHHSSKPSPANMSPTDYSHIPTPAKCYVDFCIIPVSPFLSPPPSISSLILVYSGKYGLTYLNLKIRSARPAPQSPRKSPRCRSCSRQAGSLTRCTLRGRRLVCFTIHILTHKYGRHNANERSTEGSWDEVMKVVGQAHSVVHQTGAVRVQTSMRAGTRCVFCHSPLLLTEC